MIHILFSSSAAGILRQVLRGRGRNEAVVDLTDNLSWGPIGSDNLKDREEWLSRQVPGIRSEAWDWIADSADEFRDRIASDQDRLIWIAPRSSMEQSGLYWYLASFGGSDAKMIIADYVLPEGWPSEPPPGLGVLGQDAMAGLLDGAPRLPLRLSPFPAGKWQDLVGDDALLRIVDDGSLCNAPENYFDGFLLSRCPADWTVPIRVIGYAMTDIWDAGHHADDAFLLWRMRILIESGKLACDGELPRWGGISTDTSKVRRIAQ